MTQWMQLFPSLKTHHTYPVLQQTATSIFYDASNHCWYEIAKAELTARDLIFLTQFLQQVDDANPWYVLLTQGIVPHPCPQQNIRILQYTSTQNLAQFRNAIELYFRNDAIAVKADAQTFWIILLNDYSDFELESFVGILENDFYIRGQLFIGQLLSISSTIHTQFQVERLIFKQIQHYHLTSIYTFTNSFTFLLPTLLQLPVQHYLTALLQQHLTDEMIHIITVLFEHNGNVSSSAKALHMHRNTLLYRMQRFLDDTAFDLKSGTHLFVAYLAAQLCKLTKLQH